MIDKKAFLHFLKETFVSMDDHFTYDLVENILNFGIGKLELEDEELFEFIYEIIPQIEAEEIEKFFIKRRKKKMAQTATVLANITELIEDFGEYPEPGEIFEYIAGILNAFFEDRGLYFEEDFGKVQPPLISLFGIKNPEDLIWEAREWNDKYIGLAADRMEKLENMKGDNNYWDFLSCHFSSPGEDSYMFRAYCHGLRNALTFLDNCFEYGGDQIVINYLKEWGNQVNCFLTPEDFEHIKKTPENWVLLDVVYR